MARNIYLIRSDLMDAVKIGVATDPFKRLQQLQTASADRLVLLGTIPGDTKEEKALHKRYAKLRLNGEWFRLSEDDIAEITSDGRFERPNRESTKPADFIVEDRDPWVRSDRAGFDYLIAAFDGINMMECNGMVYFRVEDVITWHEDPLNHTTWDAEMFQAARGILAKARRGEWGENTDLLLSHRGDA